MVVVRASGYLFDHQIRYRAWEAPNNKLRYWLEKLNIGGVILLGGSAGELSLRTQQLQNWANIPLLIAADIEEGVGQRFSGATWFPPPMALGSIFQHDSTLARNYAQQMGAITAQQAQAIGINWILAPVVDVNNNPANPVINVRAFGETATVVSQLAEAFIAGAKPFPVLTTAKHFPGHGDTTTDSHLDLPLISHSEFRLAAVELPPFVSAIASGVDSIMSAHLLIQAWDPHYPATLSAKILTGKLRQQLGFEGLIVTDALVMAGVAQFADPEQVAVQAVAAGADILLMPPDPERAIQAVFQAVQSGHLSPQRIQASVQRIGRAKQKVLTDSTSNLFSQLSEPSSQHTAKAITRDSLQFGGNLPLKPQEKGNLRNLILVDAILNTDFLGLHTPAVAVPQRLGYELQLVEQQYLSTQIDTNSPTLLQIFLRGNPFRGRAGLTAQAQDCLKILLQKSTLLGVMVYGSPYVAQWLQKQIKPGLPWLFSYGQMSSAQAMACEIFLGGAGGGADSPPEAFM